MKVINSASQKLKESMTMVNRQRKENKNMFSGLKRVTSTKSLVSVESNPDLRIDTNLNNEIEALMNKNSESI